MRGASFPVKLDLFWSAVLKLFSTLAFAEGFSFLAKMWCCCRLWQSCEALTELPSSFQLLLSPSVIFCHTSVSELHWVSVTEKVTEGNTQWDYTSLFLKTMRHQSDNRHEPFNSVWAFWLNSGFKDSVMHLAFIWTMGKDTQMMKSYNGLWFVFAPGYFTWVFITNSSFFSISSCSTPQNSF